MTEFEVKWTDEGGFAKLVKASSPEEAYEKFIQSEGFKDEDVMVCYGFFNKQVFSQHRYATDESTEQEQSEIVREVQKIPSISLYDKTLIAKKVFETLDFSELDEVVNFLDSNNSLTEVVEDFIHKQKEQFEDALLLKVGNIYASDVYDENRKTVLNKLMALAANRVLKKYGSNEVTKTEKMDISKKDSWKEIKKRP